LWFSANPFVAYDMGESGKETIIVGVTFFEWVQQIPITAFGLIPTASSVHCHTKTD
jgi:hypothetical protein